MSKGLKRNLNVLFFIIPFIGILFAFKIASEKQSPKVVEVNPDSISSPNYIKNLINYNKFYPFIKYSQDYIEWSNYAAIEPFFKKFKQTNKRKLKIIHIGDSHIQADIVTGFVRNRLQNILGFGGRGLIFPYAAASTHAAYDYRTSCKGIWSFSRNVLANPIYEMGLNGATIHTNDSSASFKLVFYRGYLKDSLKVIKLFCKQGKESFNLKLKASGVPEPINITCNSEPCLPYVEVNIPNTSDTLEFFINKTDTAQKFFECYGMDYETDTDKGVLYSSVGINGAGYKSILKSKLIPSQLTELNPDLVIIDLGANDFYGGAFNPTVIGNDLKRIIEMIKMSSPETCILISNSQDIYKRRRNISGCKDFSALIKSIAREEVCAYFDWFNVSGGQYSMMKWMGNGLAKRDRVHLTTAGYYVKGELILNAILNSYLKTLTSSTMDSLIVDRGRIDSIPASVFMNGKKSEIQLSDTLQKYITNNNNPPENVKSTKVYYKVKSGDNLGSIASFYHVNVSDLKTWNNLKTNNLIVGRVLVIYQKKYNLPQNKVPINNNAVINNSENAITNNKQNLNLKPVKHKVAAGESLWRISQKYNVSVDQIKKLNNLSSNNLRVGMILVIRK
ncbi:MAG: LysM peptidoglycan-binding domain-containing protein [Bacteroidetes bacterium]|nr:LysM peptidoglycan-binding domain-containing protein [Bacteroidota bacterium]